LSDAALKPVPTLPAKRRFPPASCAPSSSDPKCFRDPEGSVQPTTTNSCRREHLTLIHDALRPGVYGASARLETIPSKPSLHALRRTFAPPPCTWSEYRSIPARPS